MDAFSQRLSQRLAHIEARLDKLSPSLAPVEAMALRQCRLNARLSALLKAAGCQDAQAASISTSQLSPQQQQHVPAPPAQQPELPADASQTHARLHHELVDKGFSTFRFVRVPPDYYDRPLEGRQEILGAQSVHHLCKSIVMENTRIHPSAIHPTDALSPVNWQNPCNSRYYVILVQYAARLNADKLKKMVHQMNGATFGKQFFNFRLAPEPVSDALSGYSHNAVTPIGMRHSTVPIVMSDSISQLQPDFFFLGAGETDLKVGLRASEFVDKYKPMVADITY